MQSVSLCNLGSTRYAETWELQKKIFDLRVKQNISDVLLLNEHQHVYTLGKSSDANHLLSNSDELLSKNIDMFEIDRGGDVTYHGPGQIVGYPILDLNNYYNDIHRYLRDLEEVIIRTLAEFGIKGTRDEAYTGVWVGNNKIAAIGVKVSRWVTMHGFALNVSTDLSYFDRIIPCGIFHKGVTSIECLLNGKVNLNEVNTILVQKFSEVFNVRVVEKDREKFIELIHQLSKESTVCVLQENQ